MSVKQGVASPWEGNENHYGVILGYWDHEKTPTLIEDLEQSVDLVERKCKNLLQELIYYKKYLEESEKPEVYLAVLKNKDKKSKAFQHFSGSDPDIAYRKNLINVQETQQVFEKKFKEKLMSINEDLRVATQKLGLKNNIVLFSTDDYLKGLLQQTEDKAHSSWDLVRDKYLKLSHIRAKTRSDSIIADLGSSEQYAKISKNELRLYQKLSRLTFKRGRRLMSLGGRKTIATKSGQVKFCCRKKSSRFVQKMRAIIAEEKELSSRQSKPRGRRTKKNLASGNEEDMQDENRAASNTAIKKKSEREKEREEERICLKTVVQKSAPFTACTSTSRSYNIGLNIQQLLSLSKRREKSMAPLEQSRETAKAVEKRETLLWPPGFESEEVHRVEEGGSMWMSKKRTSSNFRRVRSKYTGSSPGSFVEYHKSTMSQYTNGQKSMIKSESKSAYAVGSKIMVSGCQRTDVFEIDKEGNPKTTSNAGDGDCNGKCAKLNSEWTQVYSAFLNTYRKYTSLKAKLSDSMLAPSNDELKSLEAEIEFAIEKYKNFLQFYSKFLHLKHRLKTLKIACEAKLRPVTPLSLSCHRKMPFKRPTSSMMMKALREVQALQDKIRLLHG